MYAQPVVSLYLLCSMKEKVLATLGRYELIRPNDVILVGLSGGPDSVALLHVLTALKRRLKLKIHAVYVNHQIRPKAASQEEKFCEKLCQKLRIPFVVVSESVPAFAQEEGIGLEEAGRLVRYHTFDLLSKTLNCTKIAVGHHQDDRVETILFRLFRGTGPTGLVGIPVKRGQVIRPLYDVSKAEILTYLKRHKVAYRVDSSNANEQFRRNYIRHSLLPAVRKRLNPSADKAILRLSEILAAEEGYIKQVAGQYSTRLVSRTPGGKIQLALSRYPQYDLWLRRRLLRYCLEHVIGTDAGVDWETVERLDSFCLNPMSRPVMLSGRVSAEHVDGKLVLFVRRKQQFEHRMTRPSTAVPELSSVVTRRVQTRTGKTPIYTKDSFRATLDTDAVQGELSLRNVRPGDRFQPLGMKGTKKVADILTDRKVPALFRDEVPVMCDEAGIVWLPGFTIAERVKVTKNTKRLIRLRYENR